ncbi:MAG: flagellar hook-basal body complex protein FliE [Roseburia sp.]
MDIASMNGIMAEYQNTVEQYNKLTQKVEDTSFQAVLSATMDMLNETNDLQNDAQSEKIKFALGEADNPHDMQIAASKALTALQYTVAIRDKMLDAYKEIMNMQI